MTNRDRMVQLRDSFPTLHYDYRERAKRPPGDPDAWDPGGLDVWVCGPAGTSGSRAAAAFVLNVWNSTHKWKVGLFNLRDAMSIWDEAHRAAFLAWCQEPFLP